MADQSCSSLSQSNRQAVTRSARIIFIPDPRLSRAVIEHNEEDSYLYEMTCWIDPQVLSRIEVAAPHCAYLPEALLGASMERDDIDLSVEALDYPDYVAAVISHSPENPTWRRLLAADAVIGGPALNENYMDPAYMIDFDPYVAGVTLLEQQVYIWPCAKSLWWGGNKALLAAQLDLIATYTTHTARPAQHELQSPPSATRMGWVQKRGYSARAEHVILPIDTQVGGKPGDHDDPAPLEASWIEQVYIDTLHDDRFGELRCFVIGGNITRIVKTVPSGGGMKCHVVVNDDWPTLAQHWKIYHGVNTSWDRPQEHNGISELKAFVLQTYQALVEREKEELEISHSDLEIVCRLDIGIMMDGAHAHYFVLEVERGLTLCMFSHPDVEGASRDIESVARCIISYI
ncbi:hypothetical protein EV715DRAFT_206868 [Schizophyllum commune]